MKIRVQFNTWPYILAYPEELRLANEGPNCSFGNNRRLKTMIISQTSFRMSFVGGGSDLGAYYEQQPGAVVSTTIDKYMYVTVNRRFDETIRVSYTKTEIVPGVDQIQHDLIREGMRLVGLNGGTEITTIADVPAAGTGLGSSSTLTVGLLNALYAFTERLRSAEQLAQEACQIEIDILGAPIGKQDQYAAAYGGLNYIQFNPDDTVFVEPIICLKETKDQLQKNLLMFYTGCRGGNSGILAEQRRETANKKTKQKTLEQMVELAKQMRDALNGNDLTRFGELLHQNWELKKQMASKISNNQINRWYEAGIRAGALGGKILGAGGGGFLLFYCGEEKQESLKETMQGLGLREFQFDFEPQGSRIIYIGG